MNLIFDPDIFALGLAVGVLGLVLLLSLIIAYAYEERTLLFLAAYIAMMIGLVFLGEQWLPGHEVMQLQLLIAGPSLVTILVMWLLRSRHSSRTDKGVMVAIGLATTALMVFYAVTGLSPDMGTEEGRISAGLALGWLALLAASAVYLAKQSWDSAGPWKWWLVLGNLLGLLVAGVFLGDVANAEEAYWPIVLMVVLQVPPIYLSLVWRSRLLNESRLRSASANVTDPLTGLATTPVLVERLMRITSRANQSRHGQSSSALFIIQVQNWAGLINELGAEFNEKLLLEAALRLRRSIGDNDLVARISGGRFAVVAQGLTDAGEISSMATRLVVSGLRIDSPQLPGVELQFRVILRPLTFAKPMSMPAVKDWLDSLTSRFEDWPRSHRARSILVVEGDASKPIVT